MICFLIFVSNNKAVCQNLKIEKQIDSIFQATIKSAENLEYDKLSETVDDSHYAGFIVGNVYYSRYDSLINDLKAKSSGIISQHIAIEKEKITVLSDNIVLLTACGTSTADVNNGNSFSLRFNWSFVYERFDGKWKVVQSHQSSSRL